MGFLADKKILITGLLSKHSIAYGIAKACHREGAELAFSYQNERFDRPHQQVCCRIRQQTGFPARRSQRRTDH
jgi:enoyl-[acyl-carrier-protein] reductase (NADH)